MSQKDKLLQRLLTRPKNFTFDELSTLMKQLGCTVDSAGKTSGSAVMFVPPVGAYIRIHKPHPTNQLKPYQINRIIADLIERGLI